jgi:hypothetical protein
MIKKMKKIQIHKKLQVLMIPIHQKQQTMFQSLILLQKLVLCKTMEMMQIVQRLRRRSLPRDVMVIKREALKIFQ